MRLGDCDENFKERLVAFLKERIEIYANQFSEATGEDPGIPTAFFKTYGNSVPSSISDSGTHRYFASQLSRNFVGREVELQKMTTYCVSRSSQRYAPDIDRNYVRLPFDWDGQSFYRSNHKLRNRKQVFP